MNAAIQEWRAGLGASNVVSDEVTIERYSRSTAESGSRPMCVLYPQSTEDVRAIVRIASDNGVVLYPISRGRNWGYGDACAPSEGSAIVDMSGMNRILEVNEELAYAVVEPGVSQRQLCDHLRELGGRLWTDSTGAGEGASFVGNTLDRGFGHTRYGDHFLNACGMEVVLADGRILNTGFGHYPNARASRVYRYGVGPSLDGLFCQSNYGIVTKIGVWLMPAPEGFAFFFIKLDRDENLAPLIERLRPLRLSGILQSALHIGNDLRILSASGRYPWAEAENATPLPDALRRLLRDRNGVGAWNGGGTLTGTKAHVRVSKKALKKAVGSLGKVVFVDDAKFALGEFAAKILGFIGLGKRLRSQLTALKYNYELMKGVPNDEPLIGAQWRLRNPASGESLNPLDSGCGLLWISPVLPTTGRDAESILSIAAPIFEQFGFELLITFTMINERSMIAILNISFDKAETEETLRAKRCYDVVVDAMISAGYIPYRVGLQGMSKLRWEGDVFWEVASQIKQALDPKGIIARGRYLPM
jgi:4-cresol dehydrogenase (hydroxylating)